MTRFWPLIAVGVVLAGTAIYDRVTWMILVVAIVVWLMVYNPKQRRNP